MQRPLALVTGGARRVGAAITESLARSGADVVVHYLHSKFEAEATSKRAREFGVDAWSIKADLRNEAEVEALMRRASSRGGRAVTILVNNASVFPPARPESATWRDIEESIRLHHWAPLVLMRNLSSQHVPASVINVLDATATEHDIDHFAYQVGKNALASLTRVMARHLAPTIRVNAVAPGAVTPPEGSDAGHLDSISSRLPLRAHGSPRDIGDAVAYLSNARFVTGVTLHVDGGSHLLGGVRG